MKEKFLTKGQNIIIKADNEMLKDRVDFLESKLKISNEALEKIKNACQYHFECKQCHLDKKTCLCLLAQQVLVKIKDTI